MGKTSLGKSIARALGRKFVRISLGGVRDEAEIRGHRRTYVGALPGRIIQGIKQAGTNNPVFMLDEIDKVGADFRGDPSAALLEVLDPEQNNTFQDHYLEVPFDLSKVLFIATANMLDTIPPALRDRMEIIALPGYTEERSCGSRSSFLVPKQLEEHGLTAEQLEFEERGPGPHDPGVHARGRRAEPRARDRHRSAARSPARWPPRPRAKVQRHRRRPRRVPRPGPLRLRPSWRRGPGRHRDRPGLDRGRRRLVQVEATKMDGKDDLMLTGQLGERHAGVGPGGPVLLRARAAAGARSRDLREADLHVHVPAGAIPKDGPSAGVTMATALASCSPDARCAVTWP